MTYRCVYGGEPPAVSRQNSQVKFPIRFSPYMIHVFLMTRFMDARRALGRIWHVDPLTHRVGQWPAALAGALQMKPG